MPESITKGQPIAQLQGKQLKCFGPQLEFKKWGKSGHILAQLSQRLVRSDDMCIIRSMTTEQINHDPRPYLYEHRHPDFGSAKYGVLGSLRIRC